MSALAGAAVDEQHGAVGGQIGAALADALGLATSWDASEDDTLRRLADCDPRGPGRAPDTARASCGA
ncbi:hypothetical protein ACIGXI_19740 [Kitasatospora aureofaciens]|uniref:hypothetical protein n=1 Tax=Kitasatospora aureofaciens TaxID=1894 RepID=UPI0037C6714B